MKTPEQYVESIRALRPEVYISGGRVESVPDEPLFQSGIRAVSLTYEYALDPKLQELAVTESGLNHTQVNRLLAIDEEPGDLLKKLELSRALCRVVGCAQRYLTHDALNALFAVTHDVDAAEETTYHQRFRDYLGFVQDEDLTCAVAMTDGKGDRSKRPSELEDPDLYLRVVDEGPQGITVRGAKAIVTGAPYAHEFIVMPTRSMTQADRDYAVAFAIPVDTPGVHMVARVPSRPDTLSRLAKAPHSSQYAQATALVVFNDVHVPWERVFLCKEHAHAGSLAHTFAAFHRHSCIGCRAGLGDMVIGASASIADYNGLPVAQDVRLGDKMAELIKIVEGFYACGVASSVFARQLPAGNYQPDEVYSNIGKHLMGTHIYDMFRLTHEIAGGIVVAAPEPEEESRPGIGRDLDRFLQGRADVTTEDRLKMARFIEDVTASYQAGWYAVISAHGGGSPASQMIEILRRYGLDERTALVRRLAGIDEGDSEPDEPPPP